MKKEMTKKIPQIKKTISAFLLGEEGKISKESIIKAGIVLTAVSLGALKGVLGSHTSSHGSSTPHGNTLGTSDIIYTSGSGSASASHAHHTSHGSHGSSHESSHESGGEGEGEGGGESSSGSSSSSSGEHTSGCSSVSW